MTMRRRIRPSIDAGVRREAVGEISMSLRLCKGAAGRRCALSAYGAQHVVELSFDCKHRVSNNT